jgi:hypothetical protein
MYGQKTATEHRDQLSDQDLEMVAGGANQQSPANSAGFDRDSTVQEPAEPTLSTFHG